VDFERLENDNDLDLLILCGDLDRDLDRDLDLDLDHDLELISE
jgi:hypothetical protein